MTSQLVIYRAFLFIYFRPPDPRSEKKSRKSTNKKIWPKERFCYPYTPMDGENKAITTKKIAKFSIGKGRYSAPNWHRKIPAVTSCKSHE